MAKFHLLFDGDFETDFDTFEEAVEYIRESYTDWLLHDFRRSADDEYWFEAYTIYEYRPIDLRSVLTTNHRGSFPKSYRGEGNNDIG